MKKKLTSILIAMVVASLSCFTAYAEEPEEIYEEDFYEEEIVDSEYGAGYAPSGIMNNGAYGINININAAPYTTFAQGAMGQYAYGKEGCAWFASARVRELTGKGSTIFSGTSWYNTQYANYGFSRGSVLKAPALACYEHHVTVVEAIVGNDVIISEGGISNGSDANHGYCIIQKISKAKLESARTGCENFIGYVYLPGASGGSSVGYNSMYRLYNPNSGEHFYTASTSEKNNLVNVGWKYEGVAWDAPINGTPVHRLYNPNAGDHHYTTSDAEKNNLVAVGWRYEGVGWYSGGSIPLYRAYNPNAIAGAHHYSTNKSEIDYIVSVGWRYESIAWYGL